MCTWAALTVLVVCFELTCSSGPPLPRNYAAFRPVLWLWPEDEHTSTMRDTLTLQDNGYVVKADDYYVGFNLLAQGEFCPGSAWCGVGKVLSFDSDSLTITTDSEKANSTTKGTPFVLSRKKIFCTDEELDTKQDCYCSGDTVASVINGGWKKCGPSRTGLNRLMSCGSKDADVGNYWQVSAATV